MATSMLDPKVWLWLHERPCYHVCVPSCDSCVFARERAAFLSSLLLPAENASQAVKDASRWRHHPASLGECCCAPQFDAHQVGWHWTAAGKPR